MLVLHGAKNWVLTKQLVGNLNPFRQESPNLAAIETPLLALCSIAHLAATQYACAVRTLLGVTGKSSPLGKNPC